MADRHSAGRYFAVAGADTVQLAAGLDIVLSDPKASRMLVGQ